MMFTPFSPFIGNCENKSLQKRSLDFPNSVAAKIIGNKVALV